MESAVSTAYSIVSKIMELIETYQENNVRFADLNFTFSMLRDILAKPGSIHLLEDKTITSIVERLDMLRGKVEKIIKDNKNRFFKFLRGGDIKSNLTFIESQVAMVLRIFNIAQNAHEFENLRNQIKTSSLIRSATIKIDKEEEAVPVKAVQEMEEVKFETDSEHFNTQMIKKDIVERDCTLLIIESTDEAFTVGSKIVLHGNKIKGSDKKIDQNTTVKIGNHLLKNAAGKLENDIIYQSKEVSREHAEILYIDGTYHLCDVGSAKGTFLQVPLMRLRQGDVLYEFETGEFFAIVSVPAKEPAKIDPKAFDSKKQLQNNQCNNDTEMFIHMKEKLNKDKSLDVKNRVIVESFPKGFTPEKGDGILQYLEVSMEEGDECDGVYLKKRKPAYLLLSNYLQSMKARLSKTAPKGTLPVEEYVSRALVLEHGMIIRICKTSFLVDLGV